MGLGIQDHTFGSFACWHSCYHAEMIRFQGWWICLRTLTYSHRKITWRHTSNVCLFLLNVIEHCSDTAWYWLWWNKGALALCCCLTYGGYGGFLAISCCWDPQNRSYLNLCRPHPRCTTLSQWIGAWDFLNHVFLLFGQLYFSSFFFSFLWCAVIWLLYSSLAGLCRSWVMEKSWEQRVRK